MDWLKSILEDEKIENKVEAISKELPNHFIPKDKYNSQADKLKEKESELAEANKQLESVNGKVTELSKVADESKEIKDKLDAISAEYDQFKGEADKRLIDVKKKQAVERGLRDANANPDTIDLLIDKFNLDEIELDDKENVKEFDRHLEPLKEQRKSLFAETKVTGDKPPEGGAAPDANYKAQYEKFIAEGNQVEAIKIKQKAFTEGKAF